MFLALNCHKHEMCEMVLKCLRKLDHYGWWSNNLTKLKYRCPPCTVQFFYIDAIMKKDMTHIPSSPKRREKTPPYI